MGLRVGARFVSRAWEITTGLLARPTARLNWTAWLLLTPGRSRTSCRTCVSSTERAMLVSLRGMWAACGTCGVGIAPYSAFALRMSVESSARPAASLPLPRASSVSALARRRSCLIASTLLRRPPAGVAFVAFSRPVGPMMHQPSNGE